MHNTARAVHKEMHSLPRTEPSPYDRMIMLAMQSANLSAFEDALVLNLKCQVIEPTDAEQAADMPTLRGWGSCRTAVCS